MRLLDLLGADLGPDSFALLHTGAVVNPVAYTDTTFSARAIHTWHFLMVDRKRNLRFRRLEVILLDAKDTPGSIFLLIRFNDFVAGFGFFMYLLFAIRYRIEHEIYCQKRGIRESETSFVLRTLFE